MAFDINWQWDWAVKVTDAAIVVATIMGPILAVQAQKYLERGRERQNRQTWIFRTLMVTRATNVSHEHVQALNAVPIEFYGVSRVMDSWRKYLAHLGNKALDPAVWVQQRPDFFADLMQKMATHLGYEFDVAQLKQEVYSPEGHSKVETDQELIRRGLADVFGGKAALPMDVKGFPSDPEAVAAMKHLHSLLNEWLEGKLTPTVRVHQESNDPK